MTTLLALYRRPDGGPDAQATFERRYADEHLPLVAGTPGLRETQRPARVTRRLGGETRPDPRRRRWSSTTGPRSTPGSRSDAMRAAGRNLREIAPGLATLLVLEDVPEMIAAASPPVDTVENTVEDRIVTDARTAARFSDRGFDATSPASSCGSPFRHPRPRPLLPRPRSPASRW